CGAGDCPSPSVASNCRTPVIGRRSSDFSQLGQDVNVEPAGLLVAVLVLLLRLVAPLAARVVLGLLMALHDAPRGHGGLDPVGPNGLDRVHQSVEAACRSRTRRATATASAVSTRFQIATIAAQTSR